MIKMNSFVITLCGLKFLIKCQTEELLKEQKKVFGKMLPSECFLSDCKDVDFVITYSKNENAFEKLYGTIKSRPAQLLKPYMNETMFKGRSARFDVFIRDKKDFIALQKDNKNFSVISNPMNTSSKNAIYTVVLEILQKELETKNTNLFHSTGGEIDGNGFLLLGQSKSGKTTLMSKLAQCSKVGFLSNDRVLCDNIKMMAFPLEIILSLGTVKNDKYLRKFFIDKKKTDNWLGRNLDNTLDYEKCGIKPKELCEIYPDLFLIQEANIDYIILPRINFEDREKINIYPITAEHASDVILDCDFTLEDKECKRYDWIYPSKLTSVEKFINAKNLINDLLKKIPVFVVEFGCNCKGLDIKQALNKQILVREISDEK